MFEEEVDENFDFNTGINKLLDLEVEKRLEEKIEDYNVALEREKNVTDEMYDLKRQVRSLLTKLDEAEKIFVKKGADEAKREMLGGYKLGDEIYYVHTEVSHTSCEICEEKGDVHALFDGQLLKAKCPKCSYGRIRNEERSVAKGRLKEIKIHTWAEERCLEVDFYIQPDDRKRDSFSFRSFDKIFRTKDECEKVLNNN